MSWFAGSPSLAAQFEPRLAYCDAVTSTDPLHLSLTELVGLHPEPESVSVVAPGEAPQSGVCVGGGAAGAACNDVFGDSVAPIDAAGLADMVTSDHRVNDQVHFQPTPGHTPGHISVVVESAGQKAIITGDMAHNPMQIADPELSSDWLWEDL